MLSGWHSRDTVTDWQKCHKNTKDTKYKATENGIQRFKECALERLKYHDHKCIGTLDRIQAIDIETAGSTLIWHRSCYSQFTHANHIKRLQERFEKDKANPEDKTFNTQPTSLGSSSYSSRVLFLQFPGQNVFFVKR